VGGIRGENSRAELFHFVPVMPNGHPSISSSRRCGIAGSNPAPATNFVSGVFGPDFPGLFLGGDKMVTTARKFSALNSLQALFAGSGLPRRGG
jgi:hypothetical protein